jgi:hypothetical protein
MKNDRETKEIELFSENTSKDTKETVKEAPKPEDKKPSDDGDHSFYDEDKKTKGKSTLFKAGIIGSVAAIALSIGLGVGLGIN